MLDEKALKNVSSQLFAEVRRLEPKAEAAVHVNTTHSANTRFARNEITTSGDVDQARVGLTVQLGLRSASASTNQVDAASLKALAERVARAAKLSPEDPETMPVLGPQKAARSPYLFDAALDALDAKARAQGVKAAIDAGREKSLDVAGFLAHGTSLGLVASSAGLSLVHPRTWLGFSVTARTADGSGSGWDSGASCRRADVDFAKIGRVAADKAARSRSPKKLEPGRYTVVLEHAATTDLMDLLFWGLDQRAVDEGRSAFSKPKGGSRVGDKLFSELITLSSDPMSATTPDTPWDGEGQPLAARTWIDKGVLKQLAVSRFWAKQKKLTPTGWYSSWALAPGAETLEGLIKGVKRGVLITRFWYTNTVDAQTATFTGLTRDGTFLIEDGAVTTPVNNFRFNQSVIEALAKVDALTKDTATVEDPSVRMPALRTHEFNLASVSDAV